MMTASQLSAPAFAEAGIILKRRSIATKTASFSHASQLATCHELPPLREPAMSHYAFIASQRLAGYIT